MAASDHPDRQIADHRLGAARLGRAQRGDGRCNDSDPHLMGARRWAGQAGKQHRALV